MMKRNNKQKEKNTRPFEAYTLKGKMTDIWNKGVKEIFVLKTVYASFLISVDEVKNVITFFLIHSVFVETS